MDQVRIGEDTQLLQIISEPYVIYGRRGYQPVINVENLQSGAAGYLVLSALSLSESINQLVVANNGVFIGLNILIKKASRDRMAPYVVKTPD